MSMISELVKGLRKLGNQWKHNDIAGCHLIFEAAATIETLSAKVRENNLNGGWIPCGGRRPEDLGQYLCTVESWGTRGINILSWGAPTFPMNLGDGVGWYDSCSDGDFYVDNVVAWMPLPEEYKG